MLDFFGSIQVSALRGILNQDRSTHALTDIDGGNDDILIVLHNPLHLAELRLHSRAMCLISSLHNGRNVFLGEFSCSFTVMFMDMAHAGRALALLADSVDPVFPSLDQIVNPNHDWTSFDARDGSRQDRES